MADVYEQNLPQKTNLTTNDYVRVVGSDDVSYKQPLSDVAQKTIENYAGSTLAGSTQSVKGAIDGLKSSATADKAELNASINEVASDLASESSTRASQDTNLQAQINQLVAPTGTAPNPAEIENARIGADNITYTTLGDAIRTQVTDLKSDLNKSQVINAVDLSTAVEGYVTKWGTVDSSNNFRLLKPLTLKRGQTIYLTGYGYSTTIAMISYYDESASSYIPIVICPDGNLRTYSFSAQADCVIALSFYKDGASAIIANRTQDLSDDVRSTFDETNIKKIIDLSTAEQGYYIDSGSCTKLTSTNFSISQPFDVPKDSTVHVFARGNAYVAMISAYDAVLDKYVPLVTGAGDVLANYEYHAKRDMKVVATFYTKEAVSVEVIYDVEKNDSVLEQDINNIYDKAFIDEWQSVGTLVSGKQVQLNGAGNNISIADGTTAYKYAWLDVSAIDKVKVYCNASSSVRYGLGYVFTTEAGVVIFSKNTTDWGAYEFEANVPNGAKYLYVNNNGQNITPKIYTVSKYANAEYANAFFTDLSLFSKIGVVGDSYASGEMYFNGNYIDNYSISWGQILARKHGITCTNYSKGGLSTRTWLTDSRGLSLMLSSPAEDLYLLVLGINDYYHLGQDYLGSLTDITSHESYVDYGDTFYGNYGKIIEQIQNHAPHAKLVIFTIENLDALPQMFSEAIIEIANYYSIPYVVQASDSFFKSAVYTTMSGGHPTALGHSGIACAFERLLDKCMRDNTSYFFDTFMYTN